MNNMRLSKARRLGVDYASLRAVHDGIIACEILAYTDDGPYADVPGRDTLVGALAGWTLDGGDTSSGPIWLRQMVGDTATAAAGTIATLLGLYHRERTGNGSRVSASAAPHGVYLRERGDAAAGRERAHAGRTVIAGCGRPLAELPDLRSSRRLVRGLHERASYRRPLPAAGGRVARARAVLRKLVVADAMACLADLGIAAEEIDPDPERAFFARRATGTRASSTCTSTRPSGRSPSVRLSGLWGTDLCARRRGRCWAAQRGAPPCGSASPTTCPLSTRRRRRSFDVARGIEVDFGQAGDHPACRDQVSRTSRGMAAGRHDSVAALHRAARGDGRRGRSARTRWTARLPREIGKVGDGIREPFPRSSTGSGP